MDDARYFVTVEAGRSRAASAESTARTLAEDILELSGGGGGV